MSVWTDTTAPQATIISGGMTLVAAVSGVVLGWWLFSGRVKDLKSAIDESDRLFAEHRSGLDSVLGEIKAKVSGLDAQFTTALESLGKLRGNVSDLQSAAQPADEPAIPGYTARPDGLRDDWNAIRDWIEQRAADPTVDGRTRAKYARIDRRRYSDLIDALAADDALGSEAPSYREAAAIWQKYRSGRKAPSHEDLSRMSSLRKLLVGER